LTDNGNGHGNGNASAPPAPALALAPLVAPDPLALAADHWIVAVTRGHGAVLSPKDRARAQSDVRRIVEAEGLDQETALRRLRNVARLTDDPRDSEFWKKQARGGYGGLLYVFKQANAENAGLLDAPCPIAEWERFGSLEAYAASEAVERKRLEDRNMLSREQYEEQLRLDGIESHFRDAANVVIRRLIAANRFDYTVTGEEARSLIEHVRRSNPSAPSGEETERIVADMIRRGLALERMKRETFAGRDGAGQAGQADGAPVRQW